MRCVCCVGQNAAVHRRVQCHHAMPENRWVTRYIGDVNDGQRSIAQYLGRAATGEQVPSKFVQRTRKLHDAGFVINTEQGPWHEPSLAQCSCGSEPVQRREAPYVINRLVITRTLKVPVIAANTTSANTCHSDARDSVPKHASRTNSMQ